MWRVEKQATGTKAWPQITIILISSEKASKMQIGTGSSPSVSESRPTQMREKGIRGRRGEDFVHKGDSRTSCFLISVGMGICL